MTATHVSILIIGICFILTTAAWIISNRITLGLLNSELKRVENEINYYKRLLAALGEEEPTCKRCGKRRELHQIFCGAACSARWEAGDRMDRRDLPS